MELLDADKLQETDNAIMEIVKELSERLGRTGHDIREVVWTDLNYAPDWPTFLLREKLGLRWELKGKLTPAEWRPLLASSTLFETRFRGRERLLWVYILSSLGISIVPTLLFFFFIFFLRSLGPGPSPLYAGAARGLSYLIIGFYFAVFFLLVAIPAPYFRRLRLRADRIANEEFGTRQDLLAVLRKIDGMSISPGGRISRLTTLAPTISRRIRNLAE